MNPMERQEKTRLADIRADHTARYLFANKWIQSTFGRQCRILDCACGVGYGSWMLADAGHSVVGVDVCPSTITFAYDHWKHPRVTYQILDALELDSLADRFDVVISFETLEHIQWPEVVIQKFAVKANVLIFSVPNEDVIPHGPGFPFHVRHYREKEVPKLISPYVLTERYGQEGRESPVEPEFHGRTLVGVGRLLCDGHT